MPLSSAVDQLAMVNFCNPHEVAQAQLAVAKLWHAAASFYFSRA